MKKRILVASTFSAVTFAFGVMPQLAGAAQWSANPAPPSPPAEPEAPQAPDTTRPPLPPRESAPPARSPLNPPASPLTPSPSPCTPPTTSPSPSPCPYQPSECQGPHPSSGCPVLPPDCPDHPDSTWGPGNGPGAPAPSGSGCSAVTGTEAMSGQPVATAIARVPDLSKMASALAKGNLAQYLDSEKDITVFVPVNDAFGKLPKFELDRMFSDEDTDWTRQVLAYHVVEGRKTRDELSNARLTTKEGHELPTRLSGKDLIIGNDAKVLCGGIQTANATVYLIDKVLIP